MGLVIRCSDKDHDRTVALKSYKPEVLANSYSRKRFLEEASTWILLGDHPNIVRAHHVELIGSPPQPYLVLEWVEGRIPDEDPSLTTLLNFRKRRPLPFIRTLGIAIDICSGIQHAAQCIPGFVHRDLKCANILICTDWTAKVTDFGISLSVDDLEAHARSASLPDAISRKGFPGTPGYVAPEQLAGTGTVDQRADIYSFGCILYEMLTGIRFIPGNDLETLIANNREGVTRKIPDALPNVLQELVRFCTDQDLENRCQSWETLAEMLTACYQELAGVAPSKRESSHEETTRFTVEKARSYLAIGRAYYDLGYPGEAIENLNSARVNAEGCQDSQVESEILYLLGASHLDAGNYREAELLLGEAVSIASAIGNNEQIVLAHSMLGALETRRGNHHGAIDHLQGALEQARQHDLGDAEMAALGNLGSAYGQAGEPDKARDCFHDLLDWCQENGDEALRSKTLASLGVAHYDLGEYAQAIEYLDQAREICRRHGDDPGCLHVLEHLVKVYTALQRDDEAARYRDEYRRLASQLGRNA